MPGDEQIMDVVTADVMREYFQLWKVVEGVNRLLCAADPAYDICGGNCGGTCPLCVARARFAPRKRPRLVQRGVIV